jgi:hypothetical protein
MKNVNSIILYLFIAVFTIFSACKKEEQEAKTLSASTTSQNVSNAAGSFSINISSNTEWSVSSNEAWCTVSPTSGSGNGTVIISYTANSNTSPRNATITIAGKDVASVSVSITQAMGERSNGVLYKNENFPLSEGDIIDFGSFGGNPNSNFDVFLLHQSEGIDVSLYFWFWSSLSTDLAPGTYTFSQSGAASSFEESTLYIETTSLADEWECTSGTVVVSKSGSEYTFDIDLMGIDDRGNNTALTAYYKGNLTYFDERKLTGKKDKRKK